ncbi:MAG: hypothetical protein JWN95_1927 [Frankiales bacterium]|nr:hypothetical protein [Frankiales bacterium]
MDNVVTSPLVIGAASPEEDEWRPSPSWLEEQREIAAAYLAQIPESLLGPAARQLRAASTSAPAPQLDHAVRNHLELLEPLGESAAAKRPHQPFLMNDLHRT